MTRKISKAEENHLLYRLNEAVERIAESENINSTLFFSKKAQKDFLRLVFLEGLDSACKKITNWREGLIKEELLNLLR